MSNPKRRRAAAPTTDHGATGPAMLARRSRIAETAAAGVTRRIIEDHHLVDRMARAGQLDEDLAAVARDLLHLAGAAGLLPGGSAPLGRIGRSSDMPDAMAAARSRWNRLLRDAGGAEAELVTAAIIEERHPGWRLPVFQATLADIGQTIARGENTY